MSEPTLPDDDARLVNIESVFGGIGIASSEYGLGADSSVTESDYEKSQSLLIEQLGGGEIRADVFIMLFSRIGRNMGVSEIASKLDSTERIVSAQLDALVDIGVVNRLVSPAHGEDGEKTVRYEIEFRHPFCADITDSLE